MRCAHNLAAVEPKTRWRLGRCRVVVARRFRFNLASVYCSRSVTRYVEAARFSSHLLAPSFRVKPPVVPQTVCSAVCSIGTATGYAKGSGTESRRFYRFQAPPSLDWRKRPYAFMWESLTKGSRSSNKRKRSSTTARVLILPPVTAFWKCYRSPLCCRPLTRKVIFSRQQRQTKTWKKRRTKPKSRGRKTTEEKLIWGVEDIKEWRSLERAKLSLWHRVGCFQTPRSDSMLPQKVGEIRPRDKLKGSEMDTFDGL